MLDHPILDVALGLIAFYVVLSLLASAIQEWIAGLLGLRSRTLRSGLENLVGDAGEIEALLAHPLLRGLARQKKKDNRHKKADDEQTDKKGAVPSYVRPSTVSAALLETFDPEHKLRSAKGAGALRTAVDQVEEHGSIKALLTPLLDDDVNTVDDLKKRLAEHFDDTMDRVSGWYKRQTQSIIVGIAIVITVAFNADSGRIARELWRHDALRAAVAAQAVALADAPPPQPPTNGDERSNLDTAVTLPVGANEGGDANGSATANEGGDANGSTTANEGGDADRRAGLEQNLASLESFPIGWKLNEEGWPVLRDTIPGWIGRMLGWLVTVAAVSLGAPFWFDLLSKVARLRAAGKPARETRG